jgi:hypothetical protein
VDPWVLDRFSAWVVEEDAPVVFYFPPLNVPYIEKAAGEAAWERFTKWKEGFLAGCRKRGLVCLDHTRLFADRSEIFMDYGHFSKPERKRGFMIVADYIAPSVRRALSRRAGR